jgi:transcriptional regulator with XRE-family HTH domain
METRLAEFMEAHGITSEQLATKAGVAVSTVEGARTGRTDPTRPSIVWMAGAASAILRRRVQARELFDLGDDDD